MRFLNNFKDFSDSISIDISHTTQLMIHAFVGERHAHILYHYALGVRGKHYIALLEFEDGFDSD
jgi:hypothetical protein